MKKLFRSSSMTLPERNSSFALSPETVLDKYEADLPASFTTSTKRSQHQLDPKLDNVSEKALKLLGIGKYNQPARTTRRRASLTKAFRLNFE